MSREIPSPQSFFNERQMRNPYTNIFVCSSIEDEDDHSFVSNLSYIDGFGELYIEGIKKRNTNDPDKTFGYLLFQGGVGFDKVTALEQNFYHLTLHIYTKKPEYGLIAALGIMDGNSRKFLYSAMSYPTNIKNGDYGHFSKKWTYEKDVIDAFRPDPDPSVLFNSKKYTEKYKHQGLALYAPDDIDTLASLDASILRIT